MATRTSGVFASATVNGYTVKTTPTTTALAGATDETVSVNIETDSDAIENKKIVAGVDIKVAYSDVAAYLIFEVSHNGTDWATAVDMSTDLTPNVTGVKSFLLDLTDIFAPYMRFRVNGGTTTAKAAISATSMGTSGTMQFFFAYK